MRGGELGGLPEQLHRRWQGASRAGDARAHAPNLGETGPVRATVITYVNPAVAAVLGVALLDEHLTAGMIVGFALVLAGSVLATGRSPEVVAEP